MAGLEVRKGVHNANVREAELFAQISEFANDPRRRTAMSQKFPDLLGRPLTRPVTRRAVEDAETRMGFPLPSLLGRLWTEVANGGFGPGYGLFGLDSGTAAEFSMSIPSVYLRLIDDHSCEEFLGEPWPKKLVMICHWGCEYYSAIDCSTVEGEVVDLLNGPERKAKGCTFAQWMRDWVNGVDLWKRDFSRLGPTPPGTAV